MNLELPDLSLLGVLVGGVAYFALGALWYAVLFSRQWMAASGRTEADIGSGPGPQMLLTLAAGIVSAAVIGLVFEWAAGASSTDGLVIGLVLGVGIAAMEALKGVVYENHTWALYAINSGYAVLGFGLAGAVYGLIA